jgi:hypothetical protein
MQGMWDTFHSYFTAELSLKKYAPHVCFGSYTLLAYNNMHANFQISS